MNAHALPIPPSPKTPLPRAVAGEPAEQLLDRLTHQGVTFTIQGGLVRWHAPRGAMTVSDLRQIKAQDAAIRARIAESEDAACQPS